MPILNKEHLITEREPLLQVLVVVLLFIFGNLKDCMIKILQLLLQVVIASFDS